MRKYTACFMMGIQKAVEYRVDFLSGYFSAVFPIIIQASMWTAIYGASGSGLLYGYSYQQMILYTFFVGVTAKFLSTGFEYEMNDDIKSGGLNKYIVKPVNYCAYRGACFLGERFSVSVVFLGVLAALSLLFKAMGYFEVSVGKIVLFLTALFLALLLNFALYFCIGISGLWLTEISRLFPALTIIILVISGGIFPLDILGENINKIIFFLPFRYLLQFPVDIITGKELTTSLTAAFLVQLFWVAFLNIIAQLLWKKGLNQYTAIGG